MKTFFEQTLNHTIDLRLIKIIHYEYFQERKESIYKQLSNRNGLGPPFSSILTKMLPRMEKFHSKLSNNPSDNTGLDIKQKEVGVPLRTEAKICFRVSN